MLAGVCEGGGGSSSSDGGLAVAMAQAVLERGTVGDHEGVLSALGVPITRYSPFDVMRRAYRGLAKLIHPDRLARRFAGEERVTLTEFAAGNMYGPIASLRSLASLDLTGCGLGDELRQRHIEYIYRDEEGNLYVGPNPAFASLLLLKASGNAFDGELPDPLPPKLIVLEAGGAGAEAGWLPGGKIRGIPDP